MIYKNLELWVKIKYNQYVINKLEANGLRNRDYAPKMNLSNNTVSAYKMGHHAMSADTLELLLLEYNNILSAKNQLIKIKRYMTLDNLYTYCACNGITMSQFLQQNQLNYFGSYRRDGIPIYLIEPIAMAL